MAYSDGVTIVTGAGGNLGSAVCAHLLASGRRVIGVDRAETKAPAGHEAGFRSAHGADLSDPAGAAAVLEQALAFGPVDGLVHTVGGFAFAMLAEADTALWHRMYTINLITTLNLFRAVLPVMRKAGRGSVVAVSAGAALKAAAGMAAYSASKSAVLRLVESAADEAKSHGVRINAVLPGTIDTPQNRAAMPDADTSGWVKPAEIASLIGFLLSDAASAVTGAAIPANGKG
jgi:NAD(P)-dependent dehydrogenase (short-subunit alcohol dehydrogenase family)